MCISMTLTKYCGGDSLPAQDSKAFWSKLRATNWVAIKCGGAAVIGAFGLKGGGTAYWGAGRAAGACLWMTFLSKVFGV